MAEEALKGIDEAAIGDEAFEKFDVHYVQHIAESVEEQDARRLGGKTRGSKRAYPICGESM